MLSYLYRRSIQKLNATNFCPRNTKG
jgi:hypothetical protein